MQFRLIRRLNYLLLITMVGMFMTMVIPQRQIVLAETKKVDNPTVPSKTGDDGQLESVTQAFIYHYLLADMAWRQGDLIVASEAMAQAAKISGDKETTLRAYGFALEAGILDIAREMAEHMIELETDIVRGQAMLLRVYVAGDKHDDAYGVLVKLMDQPVADMAAVVRYIGRVFTSVPEAGQWLGVMQRLADNLPDKPEVHLAYGFIAHHAGEVGQADDSLDKAMELRPGWEDPAILRLSWWNNSGKQEAIKAFATSFLDTNPDRNQFRLVFARLLVEWEETDAALQQFQQLVEREPENADAIFSAAVLFFQDQQFQSATAMFVRFLELEPGADQVRLYLAQISREQQRYQEALGWLSGVYREGYYLEAQLAKSRIMADQGQLDNALANLAEIMPRSKADQVQIYLVEEQILRDANRMDQALALLNAALVDIPDDSDLLYARGLVTAQLKRFAEHERDMRRLIELQPTNAHAYNALGYTLADESVRLEEALSLIEKAIELEPGDPFILDSLGWVHYRLGSYDLAVDNLSKALEIRLDPEIAAHLGEVLWVQGRVEEARHAWELGLEHKDGKKNAVLQETINRLDP